MPGVRGTSFFFPRASSHFAKASLSTGLAESPWGVAPGSPRFFGHSLNIFSPRPAHRAPLAGGEDTSSIPRIFHLRLRSATTVKFEGLRKDASGKPLAIKWHPWGHSPRNVSPANNDPARCTGHRDVPLPLGRTRPPSPENKLGSVT